MKGEKNPLVHQQYDTKNELGINLQDKNKRNGSTPTFSLNRQAHLKNAM